MHIWSIPVGFLVRPGYQIVRSLSPVSRKARLAPPGKVVRTPRYGRSPVMRGHTESGQST